ncbi:amidohydrolase [Nocardia neocaledoniensis NBRC 108232]|uniref:Aspartyl-tRNA(Asn)/glutamyl-tRNA(Gln) amidotransferase subunit A n=1 Tax=Nocardia neocaledoniensis TaxID=236511 RepID=A0A317NHY1_9NOCA|nr:amidase [Nocardia neocaledoniensis]PWV74503.1 aspartyl-tRNA(Asn)/glutamyl-tRNA(Gln) amidotransferase subunit A [Nocardia neocaledoniensis]GEM28994.1 amidohydrolase [Nocardia neocaledoniensis NBRC 108232]
MSSTPLYRPAFSAIAPSIRETAADIRSGAITSTALVEQAIARIDAVNSEINAFTYIDRAGARTRAAAADREIREHGPRGPLHGIPIAVKDVIDVAGMPTECGSAHLVGKAATVSAPIVTRLEDLGAIVLGKTVTHEFAYGPTGDISVVGPSRNPLDPTRMTGGSSGGSAAAVAAGIVPLAVGTDTGGSCRVPAALCGVTGFKPRYGQISTDGVFPLAPSLDHVGFLVADPADLRLVNAELALEPPDDSLLRPDQVTVGWLDPTSLGPADPAVVERCHSLLAEMASAASFRLVDVLLPRPQRLQATFAAMQSFEVAAVHRTMLRTNEKGYQPDTLERLRSARRVTPQQYRQEMVMRPMLVAEIAELFEFEIDVLATITTPITAPPIGERLSLVAGELVPTKQALLSMTSIWNVVGEPVISVPAGRIGGLPFGLQLVTRHALDPAITLGSAVARAAGSEDHSGWTRSAKDAATA